MRLDNIYIQGKKIFANIPIFQRGMKVDQQPDKKYVNLEAKGRVGGLH